MARENVASLVGVVSHAPTVSIIEETQTYKVAFTMKVLRRNNREDEPHVAVYGLDADTAKKVFASVREGVFVMVRGMVATSMCSKKVKCERCGAEKMVNSMVTQVVAFAPPVVLKGTYEIEALKEFANNVHLIGTVVSGVQNRNSANGTPMSLYQIAISRKFNLKEHGSKYDYPWIKTFGPQADRDMEHLKDGSQLYVNGAFQTRKVEKTVMCDDCNSALTYNETVGEIVPYDIEYLRHCVFDEENQE